MEEGEEIIILRFRCDSPDRPSFATLDSHMDMGVFDDGDVWVDDLFTPPSGWRIYIDEGDAYALCPDHA